MRDDPQTERDAAARNLKLEQLRADIAVGLAELDAGLGRELDIEELLRELHQQHR